MDQIGILVQIFLQVLPFSISHEHKFLSEGYTINSGSLPEVVLQGLPHLSSRFLFCYNVDEWVRYIQQNVGLSCSILFSISRGILPLNLLFQTTSFNYFV